MKLTQLNYFTAVCRSGSIARATDILHISQPSVSAAIRELEGEFGVRLFLREGRNLTLTSEGQLLFELAEDLLAHAGRVEKRMLDEGRNRKDLHVGIPPMIGSMILPKVFSECVRDDTRLYITEAGQHRLISDLKSGVVDLAFLPHDGPVSAEFGSLPIQSIETTFVTSPHSPFSTRESVSFAELKDCRFVLFRSGFFQNEVITRMFAENSVEPQVLFETDQLSTMVSMVRTGTADGFLFRNVASSYEGIVPVSLDPPLRLQISLCWNRSAYLNTDMLEFIERCSVLMLK